jgi:hypothetical protein
MEGCFSQLAGDFDKLVYTQPNPSHSDCAKTGLGSFTMQCRDEDGSQWKTAVITPTVDTAVIMKGGNGGYVFSLEANKPYSLDIGPSRKGISHIEFCFVCNGCARGAATPVTSAPITSAPVTSAPVTATPTTSSPTTAKPSERPTASPSTAIPVTSAPAPVTSAPAPVTATPTKKPTSAPVGGPGNSGSNKKRALEGDGDLAGSFSLLDDIDVDDGSTGVECRVAFAYHSAKVSQSFVDLGFADGIDFENMDVAWGWTNGPLVSSNYEYSFELYSADKETKVGTMSLTYDHEAVVTIEAGDRLWLKSVNAYVGHSRLPVGEDSMEIVDPAQFPVAHDKMSLSRSFTVSELDGSSPIYVVAEATVCGVFQAQPPKWPQSLLEAVAGLFRRLF